MKEQSLSSAPGQPLWPGEESSPADAAEDGFLLCCAVAKKGFPCCWYQPFHDDECFLCFPHFDIDDSMMTKAFGGDGSAQDFDYDGGFHSHDAREQDLAHEVPLDSGCS